MSKVQFIPNLSKEILLFPSRIDEDIADDAPVRIIDYVLDKIDISNILKLYHVKGRNAFYPRMMLKVIIYAYMNNIYSCRRIEELLKRDIHFIWLAGYNKPDFITINRFRNRVKDEISNVFTQLVLLLAEKGFITLDVEYVDGTKIESKANKYTFVWRKKRGTQYRQAQASACRAPVSGRRRYSPGQCNQDRVNRDNPSHYLRDNITSERGVIERGPQAKEAKKALREKKKQIKEIEKKAVSLADYEQKKETLGKRNSFSKTDPDATFMRMKEDAMNNGQTKPGYNLQIGTENQFILNYALFPNPTDTLTYIPFMCSFAARYGHLASTEVADSGYGSEENYRFMEENGIEAYVKYNMFHKEQRMHYAPSPFHQDSFFYNAEQDYYVCPMGQHMERIGTKLDKTANGYQTESVRYRAQNCEGCPLRGSCFKAKGNRVIEVNHRLKEYKRKASERLTSEDGIKHRGRRCIEPEAVFGQMKADYGYKRFRHFGKDKVEMDFAFFAIAFNLKKMCRKLKKAV